MATPLDHPVPDCPFCWDVIPQLGAHILELESKLRDLQEKLKPHLNSAQSGERLQTAVTAQ
jgi:hypothetical protein